VGANQKRRRQLLNRTLTKPKSNQDREVIEAATSIDRAVKGDGSAFSVRALKGANFITTSAIQK
jgi:hypothetical protein